MCFDRRGDEKTRQDREQHGGRGENGYYPNPFCRLVGDVSLRVEQSRADPAEKRRHASSVTGGVLRPAGRPGRFGPGRGRTEQEDHDGHGELYAGRVRLLLGTIRDKQVIEGL